MSASRHLVYVAAEDAALDGDAPKGPFRVEGEADEPARPRP
jgi:hypothetical protein